MWCGVLCAQHCHSQVIQMDPCLPFLLWGLSIPWHQSRPWDLLDQVDLQDRVLLASHGVPEITSIKLNMNKTINASNSFPQFYLSRLWSNWTYCEFFFFFFSLFNFLPPWTLTRKLRCQTLSGLGLHENLIFSSCLVLLLWYCCYNTYYLLSIKSWCAW